MIALSKNREILTPLYFLSFLESTLVLSSFLLFFLKRIVIFTMFTPTTSTLTRAEITEMLKMLLLFVDIVLWTELIESLGALKTIQIQRVFAMACHKLILQET